MENPDSAEWQAPPPPEKIVNEQAEMSEIGTLIGSFFEPGRTFEDLRRKPRFIIASVIIALLVTAYGFGLVAKVGESGIKRAVVEAIEKSPQASAMSNDQKESMISMNLKIQSYTRYAIPVFVLAFLFLGGLFYFLGAKAFGGNGSYMQNLSVWVYSTLPPTVVGMIANFIVLAFKTSDEIDLASSQRGLIHANPSILIDGKAMPVLATLIGTLDIFMIWGWVLAAIGLRVTNKLSSGSAWAVVIIFGLIGLVFRVIGAYFSGNPG